jgi:thiamine monophosphate kinase
LRIDASRIPILRGCTLEDAARGGEEYELVVVSPHELDADAFAREFALPLSEIGRARRAEQPGVRATLDGAIVDLGVGHDHFSR